MNGKIPIISILGEWLTCKYVITKNYEAKGQHFTSHIGEYWINNYIIKWWSHSRNENYVFAWIWLKNSDLFLIHSEYHDFIYRTYVPYNYECIKT